MGTSLSDGWWRYCFAIFSALLLVDAKSDYGIMIDGGSQGTRLHIYEWGHRVFNHVPVPISVPITQKAWTERIKPGIASFVDHPGDAGDSLEDLLRFARENLEEHSHRFGTFPVYFKATGGLRTLPYVQRERVLDSIRLKLHASGFLFHDSFARVISGEEEGVYAWATVNFLGGTLRAPEDSELAGKGNKPEAPIGAAGPAVNGTIGSLDLGGASAQITFYQPRQDILANLFRLQVGRQAHWNLYTHSFLHFGRDLAYSRVLAAAAGHIHPPPIGCDDASDADALAGSSNDVGNSSSSSSQDSHGTTGCLFHGYSTGWSEEGAAEAEGAVTLEGAGNYAACLDATTQLLRKDYNGWCEYSHPGQCSFIGVYLPPLHTAGSFVAFSGYAELYRFLQLPVDADLKAVQAKGNWLCSLSWEQVEDYERKLPPGAAVGKNKLPRMCFLSAYVVSLLHHGFGFPMHNTGLLVTDSIKGQEVGWTTGAMLTEINTLAFQFEPTPNTWLTSVLPALCAGLAVIVGLLLRAHFRLRQRFTKMAQTLPSQAGESSCSPLEKTPLLGAVGYGSVAS